MALINTNDEGSDLVMSRVVSFYPELAKAFGGDPEAAIYLQQLFYWSDKGSRDDGYIYKSKNEIEAETGLSRDKQDRVRKKLEKMGYLSTKLVKANGVPTLHYRVKISLTLRISGKPANPLVENPLIHKWETHQSITENTTETTTYTLSPTATAPNGAVGEELQYIPDDDQRPLKKPKSKYGSRTMAVLAQEYCKVAGIEAKDLRPYMVGLSKLYHSLQDDAGEAIKAIRVVGAYMNEKGLPWSPEAVWRNYQNMPAWSRAGKNAPASGHDVHDVLKKHGVKR